MGCTALFITNSTACGLEHDIDGKKRQAPQDISIPIEKPTRMIYPAEERLQDQDSVTQGSINKNCYLI